VYEKLQKLTLELFTLTFIQLIFLGIPVSIATIILSLAEMRPPVFPIMYVVLVGCVWIGSCAMMWILQSVWSIPIGRIGPIPITPREE